MFLHWLEGQHNLQRIPKREDSTETRDCPGDDDADTGDHFQGIRTTETDSDRSGKEQ
jgi:hypothetical protein